MCPSNLLNKAYACIEAGDFQNAADILEYLVQDDPLDIESWEAYMQICGTCEELDHLCNRMLDATEIGRTDRESILDYYYFLRQKIRSHETNPDGREMITFELVDQFTYALKGNHPASTADASENLGKGVAWFIRKAILVSYIILAAISMKLLFAGKNIGHWIVMALALGVLILVGRAVFRMVEPVQNSYEEKSDNVKQKNRVAKRKELLS